MTVGPRGLSRSAVTLPRGQEGLASPLELAGKTGLLGGVSFVLGFYLLERPVPRPLCPPPGGELIALCQRAVNSYHCQTSRDSASVSNTCDFFTKCIRSK